MALTPNRRCRATILTLHVPTKAAALLGLTLSVNRQVCLRRTVVAGSAHASWRLAALCPTAWLYPGANLIEATLSARQQCDRTIAKAAVWCDAAEPD